MASFASGENTSPAFSVRLLLVMVDRLVTVLSMFDFFDDCLRRSDGSTLNLSW